jgi:hypothetical protein
MTASPNPVGVGQGVYLGAMFSKPTPTNNGGGGDFYDNVTIDVIDPDGVKTVYGPWITSRAAGIQFTYTPSKVGNYSIQAHYPGQVLIGMHRGGRDYVDGWNLWLLNSTMLPSDSNILTLVVNEEPTEPMYQSARAQRVLREEARWLPAIGHFFTASLIRVRPVSTRCVPPLRGLMVTSLYSGLHSKKGICAEGTTT